MGRTIITSEIKSKSNKYRKVIFASPIILILLVILISVFSDILNPVEHATSGEDWKVINTQSYIRNNQECIGYRVYVDARSATTKKYKSIFEAVTKDDGYYLHTVWFYFTSIGAKGNSSADVIMEQTRENELPNPQKN